VLRPDGVLVLADAVLNDHHGHHDGRGPGGGRRQGGMREQIRDNVSDAVSRLIAAAGFIVEPTRTMALRIGG
jgi:hypothetical protein